MCLLITQSQHSPKLSNEWLTDFYESNSDGVGVMTIENSQLVINKILPKSAHEFIDFYRSNIQGRDCAYHLRMRTHGATDLENCHPYEVLNKAAHGIDLWLMHNGILSTGNQKDISKSDTWHYIRDYLRPMLANNPDYAFTQGFADIIGEHIGASNKFVLMDNSGRVAVVNRSSGVYWGGLWLSNTYAWSASKSVSKTPIKGLKKQAKQVKEKPAARVQYAKYPKYWGNKTAIGYMDGYGYDNDDDESGDYWDYFDDIEIMLSDMAENGYSKAASVSLNTCMDFVNQFGLDAFNEVSYMVLDGNIGEDWYIKVMTDEIAAREAFPFLGSSYSGKGYQYAE